MAKLIEGIPGRKFEPEFDIDEDTACIFSEDDQDDVDLYLDMCSYGVDDTQSPAIVKVLLQDGNFVVVSMKKHELAVFTKEANASLGINTPPSDSVFNEIANLTSEERKEMIALLKAKRTPAQKAAGVFVKIAFGICAVLALILILAKIL